MFRQGLPLTVMWLVCLLYLEALIHIVLFGKFSLWFGCAVGFSLSAACVLGFLTGLLRERANKIICTVIVCLLCFVYASQLTYNYVFGTMYSLSMVSLGAGAITSFWKELLAEIWENLPVLLLCFVPIVAVCLLRRCHRIICGGHFFAGGGGWKRLALIAAAVLIHVLLLLCLRAGGTGNFTPYGFYYGNDTTTDRSTSNFGLLTTFRLELKHKLFPKEEESFYVLEPEPALSTPKPTPAVSDGETDGETVEPEPEIDYGYNVLEIDFDALAESTDDERLKRLSQYCSQLTGTKKNKYTGMLSDYNLIVICGESFSTAAVDEELTPTLWRMAHEGFVFTNYFNTYPNTTTDGEYSLLQGLMPDNSRGKLAPSFYASRRSYLPMCLGNIFAEQRGVESFGYHGYWGDYYGRSQTHRNIGYQMKFAGNGMYFSTSWPSSDLEMMEQSVGDYLELEQFNAYYMTFSGHYKYDRNNVMAKRNYDAVKDLPYSEPAKCYLACNIELEKAMAYLMEQLEEAGVADRTAIVLAGDHFPYGLTEAEYSELIGYEADFFELYRDTLIFWVGGMEEPVTVEEYCCNIDILPTILNLWGFDFDSRLLAGTDILSDGTHVAILADKSFLNDSVWFNSGENKAIWQVEESESSQAYLDSMNAFVQNKFTASADILNSAYYNFVFGKDAITIGRDGWISEEAWNAGTITGGQNPAPAEQPAEGGTAEPPTGEGQ
ncbi:MAG: LTA synthase family protein, partial [Butyricicoccus sp.]|nr:LTA synthase family protein [Butyricicoccus sp.]